ncbi:MAG: patatin-like phospholipase family protein [Bacteroidales bacterium]|nr:patatin-like phospholipase family protein [Bacteroidales bacterium]
MKNIALVLSSGGARGLAHIGVIEELESRGYNITSVAGASMGSLVGGMYAAGKLAEVKDWMLSLSNFKKITYADFSLSLNHIVRGEKIINAFKNIAPEVNIENLPIPYCAVATDWRCGTEVVFNKGSLYEAIRSSISIPLFFKPVQHENMILVDGGIINPLPLNRVKRTDGDIIVSVNVNGPKCSDNDENSSPNYINLLTKTILIMIHRNSELSAQICKPDISIEIPFDQYGGFEYDKVEEIIEYGRTCARQVLDGIRNTL